jgi:glycosyltransferase involved in cell wall biosynthesis
LTPETTIRVHIQPDATPKRVLVAIPCYNEELAIAGVVLRARKHADDVLVIDDGSKDRTAEVARLAGATVLVNEKNSGKGHGVRRAFRHAYDGGYDALVLLDGDGQHDPDEIPQMLEPIVGRNGSSVDIALGFRFGDSTEMPVWRRVGKRVLDYATAASGAGVVTDSQCGYRAFNRKAITAMTDRLGGDGFSIESEQLVVAKDVGLTHDNVRISCRYDGIDGSTKGPIEHALGVLQSMFDMVTTKHPMRFLAFPGALLLLGAVWTGIHTLQYYNTTKVFLIAYALGSATLAILGAMSILVAVMLKMMSHMERRIGHILK